MDSATGALHKNGGLAAVFAGIGLSLINGMLYSWSVFVLPIEQATGWIRSQTSLVFTFILVFFAFGMMTGGFIMRRFGPRLTAAGGGCLLALGFAGSAFAGSLWQLVLAYGVVAGYGIGVANIVPTAVCLAIYPHKRGLICGIMAFALAFGTLLFGSGLATFLIGRAGVWDTLLIMAALALAAALASSLFLRYPKGRRPLPGSDSLAGQGQTSLSTGQMLGTLRFRLIWLWAMGVQTGGLMIIGHVVPYAVERGASPAQAGVAMGVYAVANGVGRLLFGLLFDKKGFYFSMLCDAFCMVSGLGLLLLLPPLLGYAGILLGVVVIALAFGGTIPQFSAYIAQNFGPAHLETNIGMTATAFIVAGFVGPFAGGYLQIHTGSYSMAIVAAIAISATAIPAMLAAGWSHRTK